MANGDELFADAPTGDELFADHTPPAADGATPDRAIETELYPDQLTRLKASIADPKHVAGLIGAKQVARTPAAISSRRMVRGCG